ncbi:MAG: LptA/OstA family protein, partial [Candidatus Tectimicrobiota bacterium]
MSRIATSPSWWVALASLTLALGFASPGWGLKMLPQGLETEDRDVPITVTAERMEVDHAAHIIRFHGYVITTKGSMIMRSNLLEVFNTGSGEGLGNIQRIVAQGDV